MESSEASTGRPACPVHSFPDVSEVSSEDRAVQQPASVSRVSASSGSSSRKTAIGIGLILSYSLIGIMAANMVIWFVANPQDQSIDESSSTQVAAEDELNSLTDPNVRPVNHEKLIIEPVRDPAVSEQLRLLLNEKRKLNETHSEQDRTTGDHSDAEIPVRTRK